MGIFLKIVVSDEITWSTYIQIDSTDCLHPWELKYGLRLGVIFLNVLVI